MNYHHIYHAGNFADILKHIILCLCLDKMLEKDNPFFVLDTHSGTAKYNLNDEKSLKTNESSEGIKKLIAHQDFVELLPNNYLKILAKVNKCNILELQEKLNFYCGSPFIIQNYLRSNDRAFFCELNNNAYLELQKNLVKNNNITFFKEDGFNLLKSVLPPQEKRGIIIIDPAFEKDQSKVSIDWQKIAKSLIDAKKRFKHGIYIIWYPIIKNDEKITQKLYQDIKEIGFEKVLNVTIDLTNKINENKMQSCGVIIINAPWQIEDKLNKILPSITELLKNSNQAYFNIESL